MGIKPFYYTVQNGLFSFALDIKTLIPSGLYTPATGSTCSLSRHGFWDGAPPVYRISTCKSIGAGTLDAHSYRWKNSQGAVLVYSDWHTG